MLKKILNVKILVAVVILMVFAGAALAQTDAPQAPDAVRVKIIHLAPFPGSDSDVLTVTVDANPVGTGLQYGDFINYVTLSGPGDHTFNVLRNGNPFRSKVINLQDGDHTVVILGNLDETPADLAAFADTAELPDIGKVKLRVINVAPLGYTLADTSVDVCSQAGVPFTPTGNDLRYKEATIFRILNTGEYNLKITDWIEGSLVFCTGPTVIDPVPVNLADRSITTLFLAGDNTNQEAQAYSVELGFLDNEETTVEPATLTIIKQVVGAIPGAAWQFSGTNGLGAFTIPAAGGNKLFTELAAGSYQIAETAVSGYTTTVSCTNGAAGTNSVTVNLAEGDDVTCTFVNTEAGITPPPPTAFCEVGKSCAGVPAVFGSPLD